MLLAVPGWRRARRYRLTSGTAPAYLSLHELASLAVFEEPAYRAAMTTPWMKRIVDSAIGRERRVFGLHKSFASDAAGRAGSAAAGILRSTRLWCLLRTPRLFRCPAALAYVASHSQDRAIRDKTGIEWARARQWIIKHAITCRLTCLVCLFSGFLAVCGFGLVLPTGVAGCLGLVLRALGAAGAGLGGFRALAGRAGCLADGAESGADPAGGHSVSGPAWGLPGQPDVGGERAGQVQLGVGRR